MSALTTHSAPDTADIIVIGAGINGLAIGREAAAQGLSVVMIDADDIAARTSSIATRLIHGGLKYLERFELALVFESIRERNILLRTAPHLVKPYPMLIPFSKSASRPGWLLSCGLMLHDVLSVGKKLPLNRIVFRKRLQREWSSVADGGVRWGGLFQDAHVPVTERFAVELAIDAARRGAFLLTHSPVTSLVREDGRVAGVRYLDRDTGQQRELRSRVVVNAAGPWVDRVLDLAGDHARRIGPTKGSHLVVDAFDGAPDTCIFFESPEDHRPMFVLPWWGGKYMVGTTDLPFDGSIDEIAIDDDEVAYLLKAVNDLIPAAALTPADVLWSYSGVRPLPYVADLTDPATVSRDSEIVVHDGDERGLVTIIGGKYTTHRALGEQVVRKLARPLGVRLRRSPTRDALLPGAPGEGIVAARERFIGESGLPSATATRLFDVYGRLAERVAATVASNPVLGEVIDEESGAIAAEIVHAVHDEGAVTLEDVLLRRTAIALGSDVGLRCAPRAAAVLVTDGIWDEERAESELASYREAVRRFQPRVLRQANTREPAPVSGDE